MGNRTVVLAWLGALMYFFQIYFDFSGYSDMAIGLGRIFGFHFPENFNYPYMAKSITEFWRRWHITLGTWFREYVYIPLGGNRCGKVRQIRNLLIVWALTGIWHGVAWNFLLWGLYFFVLLALEKFAYGKTLARVPAALTHVYALFFVLMGWVLFSNDSLSAVGSYLESMFSGDVWSAGTGYLLLSNWLLVIILAIGSTDLPKRIAYRLMDALGQMPVLRALVRDVVGLLLFGLCVAALLRDSYNPFLYFRF